MQCTEHRRIGSAPFRLIPIRLIPFRLIPFPNPNPNPIPNPIPIPNPNPNHIPNPHTNSILGAMGLGEMGLGEMGGHPQDRERSRQLVETATLQPGARS